MQTMISCMGNSDPIRNFHDGPMLHLARVLKPDKIVLVHTEMTQPKHHAMCKAIRSIPDYNPIIKEHNQVISNIEVFIFDTMFEKLNSIVTEYYENENQIILNLSSGTPQIISAFFSINRINEYNVNAYQVATPNFASNAGISHENIDDIDLLIEMNEDNNSDFYNRVFADDGEVFNKALLRHTMSDFIDAYNYSAVFDLSVKHRVTSKKKRKKINRQLDEILNFESYQRLLPDVKNTKLDDEDKVLLNAALLVDLQRKRNLTSEVLIRIQNLTEKMIERYLETHHEGIIFWKKGRPYLNKNGSEELVSFINEEFKRMSLEDEEKTFDFSRFLSLPVYIIILKYLEADQTLIDQLNRINAVKHHRNIVAHDLKEIGSDVDINKLTNTCWELLEQLINLDEKWYTYFEDINQELKNLIHS